MLTESEKAAITFGLPQIVGPRVLSVVENILAARTEAADREAARVTAAVLDRLPNETHPDLSRTDLWDLLADLRAALSSAGTDALDRERAKAWDEGWAARAEYEDRRDVPLDWPDRNPYRAAAVSPEGGGA